MRVVLCSRCPSSVSTRSAFGRRSHARTRVGAASGTGPAAPAGVPGAAPDPNPSIPNHATSKRSVFHRHGEDRHSRRNAAVRSREIPGSGKGRRFGEGMGFGEGTGLGEGTECGRGAAGFAMPTV
ncbi:hypothetical protein GCM10023081_44730 [Arthrobacter ginkgonis]|uniref:Uncharacterized protein n=1 Tax=Arthrobacter ginkgonis TaxID=1630594 RepID=A0ABP7DEG5_9MICC